MRLTAEELWQTVTATGESISYVAWPTWDESKLVEDEIEIVVQIKGKVRAKFMVAKTFHAKNCTDVGKPISSLPPWLSILRDRFRSAVVEIVSIGLTVYFEGGFWHGLFEQVISETYQVCQ